MDETFASAVLRKLQDLEAENARLRQRERARALMEKEPQRPVHIGAARTVERVPTFAEMNYALGVFAVRPSRVVQNPDGSWTHHFDSDGDGD